MFCFIQVRKAVLLLASPSTIPASTKLQNVSSSDLYDMVKVKENVLYIEPLNARKGERVVAARLDVVSSRVCTHISH